MSYDRIDWHSESGDFPNDLPAENGGTHIGMFLAWAINNNLQGIEHEEDCPQSLEAVRLRLITGREFLMKECDGKFIDDDLNDEGNAFARFYYSQPDYIYLLDFDSTLASGLPTSYHVEDTWENYDRIAAVISQRFEKWKVSGTSEPDTSANR